VLRDFVKTGERRELTSTKSKACSIYEWCSTSYLDHFYYDNVFSIFMERQTPVCVRFSVLAHVWENAGVAQSRRVSASTESKPTECLSTQVDIKRNRGPAVE